MTATRTHTFIDSPIGPLTLVQTDGALSGLYLAEHRHRPDPATFGSQADRGFEQAREQLDEYFAGDRTEFPPDAPYLEERLARDLATEEAGADLAGRHERTMRLLNRGLIAAIILNIAMGTICHETP